MSLNKLDQNSIGEILSYLTYPEINSLFQDENFTLNSKQILKLFQRHYPRYIRELTVNADKLRHISVTLHTEKFKDLIIKEIQNYKKKRYPLLLRRSQELKENNNINFVPLEPDEEIKRILSLDSTRLHELEETGYSLYSSRYTKITIKKFNWDFNLDKPIYTYG